MPFVFRSVARQSAWEKVGRVVWLPTANTSHSRRAAPTAAGTAAAGARPQVTTSKSSSFCVVAGVAAASRTRETLRRRHRQAAGAAGTGSIAPMPAGAARRRHMAVEQRGRLTQPRRQACPAASCTASRARPRARARARSAAARRPTHEELRRKRRAGGRQRGEQALHQRRLLSWLPPQLLERREASAASRAAARLRSGPQIRQLSPQSRPVATSVPLSRPCSLNQRRRNVSSALLSPLEPSSSIAVCLCCPAAKAVAARRE